jgi:hypothetical protein
MNYEFLHHLVQALLPVVIYDVALIQKLIAYENQRLLVTLRPQIRASESSSSRDGIRVVKITAAGRRVVRRHCKARNIETPKVLKKLRSFLR